MSINITVTKKILEAIVHETFSNFGFLSSSSLLDSLKLLGFYYATNAGISINIEDLKTPDLKKRYIENAKNEIQLISQNWSEGKVSDQERFQSIIDSWNLATESLKNRIVDYYQEYDPANNLYIMAFSGARGNMSQVRQLVGMRGLMSDQEGKIIDLPIQANFREGLSSIDYIISSYGARKGIVDTALKTADSGYLTRRLIYLAQDLIVREIDCKTKKGILVFLKKKSSFKNLIGRHLLSAKQVQFPFSKISSLYDQNAKENFNVVGEVLTHQILEKLKILSPLILNIRSSLTCESKSSLCQKCYGWDLAHQKLISLGETVGILAAQSIGEPGTQLTMRTFHTGGIFTGETLKQIKAPFSGKIIIPNFLNAISFRTNHGINILKLQQETEIKLVNWKGFETTLFLEINSYLYISQTTFVYHGQLIAEFLNQSVVTGQAKLKPIYTHLSGKVICDGFIKIHRKMIKGKERRKILQQSLLWIASGKIYSLPKEAEYSFPKILSSTRAIAKLKIITPKEGLINLSESSILIITKSEKITILFSDFNINLNNTSSKFVPLVRNYQYVDANSLLGFIYIFSKQEGKIFSIEEKQGKLTNTFLITTKNDLWNFYGSSSDFKNNLISLKHKNYNFFKNLSNCNNFSFANSKFETFNFEVIRPTTANHGILNFKNSGIKKYQDFYLHSFQNLESICIPADSILNYKEDDFVEEKQLFATLVNYTQQTDDIVQGLPKIEELIEARKPKIEACLANRPSYYQGILSNFGESDEDVNYEKNCSLKELNPTNLLIDPWLQLYGYAQKNNLSELENEFEIEVDPWFLRKKNESQINIFLPEKKIFQKVSKKGKEKKKILMFLNSLSKGKKKRGNYAYNYPIIYNNLFYKIFYFSTSFKFDQKTFSFKDLKTHATLDFSDKNFKWECLKTKKELGFFGKNYNWQSVLMPLDLRLALSNFFETQIWDFNYKNDEQSFNYYPFNKDRKWYNDNIFNKKKIKNLNQTIKPETSLKKKNKIYNNDYEIAELNDINFNYLIYEAKNEYGKMDYIFQINKKISIYLKNIAGPISYYALPQRAKILIAKGEFIDLGEPITEGNIDSNHLLNILFEYHTELDGTITGTLRSLSKFQLILSNSIQSIYQSQGVNISSKHIEIIVRQMTSKVIIKSGGDTPFLPGELISTAWMVEIYLTLRNNNVFLLPMFEPKLLSATNSSLNKDGFLSAAGFQETRKILTKAAVEGSTDWLRGLKESIMSGRMIPAGSAFLNYKNYLDNIYFLKK